MDSGPAPTPSRLIADLDIQVPISGKPEIGARPGMTRMKQMSETQRYGVGATVAGAVVWLK
jgi:hypothetical protein